MAEAQDAGTLGSGAPGAPPSQSARLLLNTHYIKDLSFENPNAPQVYVELPKTPSIDVSVDVDANQLQDRFYEVVLSMRVKATTDGMAVFLVELEFGGLATIGDSVPQDEIERILLVDVPRYLFPFARAVVGDVTRDGGFPPLLINPIGFDELYENRKAGDAELA